MSEIDFHCGKCGKECDSAPEPPARAICEEHCEDHEYTYDRGMREHYSPIAANRDLMTGQTEPPHPGAAER